MARRSTELMAEKRNGVMPPVTEREARAAYVAMEGRRSIRGLHQRFVKEGTKPSSLRTMQKWSMKHHWVRLAHEHDEKVATAAAEKIAEAATAGVVTRAMQFDTLATESLVKAIEGLAKIDVASLKAADIRALAEISERASKMYELIEGRATDRTDGLTRAKMDALLAEMQREVEERLARVPAIHRCVDEPRRWPAPSPPGPQSDQIRPKPVINAECRLLGVKRTYRRHGRRVRC